MSTQQNQELQKTKPGEFHASEDSEEQKTVSVQLTNDLKTFKMAVDQAWDHMVITDKDGVIMYANNAVERITGYNLQEILGTKAGKKWSLPMPKAFYENLWNIIKTKKQVFNGEVRNRRKNGELYDAKISISPVLDEHGEAQFFVGIERDITQEKNIDRMKTEFISIASHQLRTPLSAMKWFLEMLLAGDVGKLIPEQNELVDNVSQSNERMIVLVNSLLNISRIESGRIIVDPVPTDLVTLVNQVLVELQPQLKEMKQHIMVSAHTDLPLVNVDPKLIQSVYTNLLTNAIKYSPEGSDIQLCISKRDTDIVSQITDPGYGIPREQQHRVFEKFFRADNIVKKVTDGNGLGLYLAKAVVYSSGGTIWFESEEGKGSTFWFSLPLSGSVAKKGEVSLDS